MESYLICMEHWNPLITKIFLIQILNYCISSTILKTSLKKTLDDMNRNTFATECYKGDTYRTNKFIKNNKFVVLEEAISELSHKE